MFPNKTLTPYSQLLVLLFLICVMFGILLGSRPLNTPDEGRYSEIAREMVISHDYISPRVNGVLFLDKPPLYYWLQASAIKLLGTNNWSLRLWPALIAMLGCLICFTTCCRVFDNQSGFLAALILATSPIYFLLARYADMNIEVAVFITASLCLFISSVYHPNPNSKRWLMLGAYFSSALAVMTKGLIGIVFPMMIIGLWILIFQEWRILKNMYIGRGLLLIALITVPWHLLIQRANPQFLHFYFYTQQFSRYLSNNFNAQKQIWFYIPVILLGFFPWTIFLFAAFKDGLINFKQNLQQTKVIFFLLIWAAVVMIFFSVPKSKIVGYILPIFPPLAMLCGNYIAKYWQHPQPLIRVIKIIFSFNLLFTIISLWAVNHFSIFNNQSAKTYFLGYFIISFLGAGLAVYFTNKKIAIAVFILMASSTLALWEVVYSMPYWIEQISLDQPSIGSIQPLAKQLNQFLTADDKVVCYQRYYYDLPIYIQRPVYAVTDWTNPKLAQADDWRGEFSRHLKYDSKSQFWLLKENDFWQQWRSAQRVFVILHDEFLAPFQTEANSPVFVIGKSYGNILLTNKPISHAINNIARERA